MAEWNLITLNEIIRHTLKAVTLMSKIFYCEQYHLILKNTCSDLTHKLTLPKSDSVWLSGIDLLKTDPKQNANPLNVLIFNYW